MNDVDYKQHHFVGFLRWASKKSSLYFPIVFFSETLGLPVTSLCLTFSFRRKLISIISMVGCKAGYLEDYPMTSTWLITMVIVVVP